MAIPFVESLIEKVVGSFPLVIGIVLAAAFISMLVVTIWTLISIRKAEKKPQKPEFPPSSDKKVEDFLPKDAIYDMGTRSPFYLGEHINKFLIINGLLNVNNVVRSFFKAMDFMKKSIGSGYKYKMPWFMIVGTTGAGKSSLISGFTYDEVSEEEEKKAECAWWFLKNGVMLDISGDVFMTDNGEKADEKSWRMVLEMLVRYRSAKPLNGIILTIPATELYGKNKLSIEEIKRRAQYMSRKLNFAQNYIGLKLPVYIVITKTDIVPGFQSFCSEIPVRNRNNMLGWSCPYSLESAYSSKWLEDAFDSVEDELNEIRMEIFSERGSTSTRDGIFVFPSELLTVKENLSLYIDTIFRTGAMEEKFYFRGMYFTGDSKMVPLLQFSGSGSADDVAILGTPDAGLNEEGSLTASLKAEEFAPKKIFFFEDLILKKIFLEDGIATPMRNKVYQSNKAIFVAKISTAAFVMIGSYGLFHARDQLKLNKDNLYPSLFKVSSIIKNTGTLTMQNLENNGNEILSECTTQLLSMMQQLNQIRFSSIFVPASWISNINKNLTETLRISYQRVVIRTIYMNLILKARNLLNLKPDKYSENIEEFLLPYNSKEYILLRSFVESLIELDRNIKKFDSLRTSGDSRDLEDLVDYTFQGSLPQEFLENYEQFRRILMNTPFPPIDLSPYKKVAYDVLILLFQNFIDAIFEDKLSGNLMSTLNNFIGNLNKQNISRIPNCAKLIKFSKGLAKAVKEMGKEGETWLDKEVFEADEEYNKFLDNVEELFGKDLAQNLLDMTASSFEDLKMKLKSFNALLKSDIPGNKLNTPPNKDEEQVPLSSGIFTIEKAMSAVADEPYMQEAGKYRLVTDIPEGKMMYWDDELIQYAYEISKRFEQFFGTAVKDFPRPIQEGITLLARANMCAVIADTVAKAQSFVDVPSAMTDELASEELLQQQAAELRSVSPKFVSLLKSMISDKVSVVYGDLRAILNKAGFSLLEHVDKLLENQKPYVPQNLDFEYWDGQPEAAHMTYSTNDTEELKQYVLSQRKILLRLALDFAEPIINLLNNDIIFDQNFGNHGRLRKWTKIVNAANGFKTKNPVSPIIAIEKFILKTMNTYTIDNITELIPLTDIQGEGTNYIDNIIKQIKKGMLTRAEVLIRQRSIERYNKLLSFYNKNLVNKYPFYNYDNTEKTGADANIDYVRAFFALYDEYGGTPEKVIDQIYQLGEDAAKMYEFLKKLHDLRTFFKGSIDGKRNSLPKITMEIDFDIGRGEEKNTKHLIDKIFKPNAGSNIEFITEDKTGIWYFGDPIQMVFRWVSPEEEDDSIDYPLEDKNNPDISINDATATLECLGNWSILRFLQKYQISPPGSIHLSENQTMLCFSIPINKNRTTKIYAAFTASYVADDKTVETLKVPTTTEKMPEINSNILAVKNHSVVVERATAKLAADISSLKEDDENEDEKTQEEPSSEKKTEEGKKKATKQKEEETSSKKAEAVKILESEEEENEETPIEISEEPIE
ncbi:MAG: hypothetical protein LBG13_02280 [Holosporales bacterium]|jgi:type VI secretion system protein ImpL|nr:hypothetical protein [Holosporales bacterium]